MHGEITANDNTYVIMLMLNTDGAPVFKSQNYSIWPLYASVLELAPERRYVHVYYSLVPFTFY